MNYFAEKCSSLKIRKWYTIMTVKDQSTNTIWFDIEHPVSRQLSKQ